jgi:hypothetical protein
MKNFSFQAACAGGGVLLFSVCMNALGHPPFSFLEAFFLAGAIMMLSAVGGFEWGFSCLIVQAGVVGVLREFWWASLWLLVVACVWYAGATLLAVRGSRALMGIAAGVLFVELVGGRALSFSWSEWGLFIALLILEVSGMFFVGNAVKGRWFSPYA